MDSNLFYNLLCKIVQLIKRKVKAFDIYDSITFRISSLHVPTILYIMVIVVLEIHMPLT